MGMGMNGTAHDLRHVADELDDGLGPVVPGRRLAADAGEALLHLRPVCRGHALDLHVPVRSAQVRAYDDRAQC